MSGRLRGVPLWMARGSRAWPVIRALGRPIREALRRLDERLFAPRLRATRSLRSGATVARSAVDPLRRRQQRRVDRRDPEAAARAGFDAPWYAAQHPDAAADPWGHYRAVGVAAGHPPNALFDVATYRHDHPALSPDADPLVHWVLDGRWSGSTPHPLIDPDWYRAAYPDVGAADAYRHYLAVGRAARRAASPAVDAGTDIAGLRPELPAPTDPAAARVTVIVRPDRTLAGTIRGLVALGRRTPAGAGVRIVLADDPRRPLADALGPVPGLEVITLDAGTDVGADAGAAARATAPAAAGITGLDALIERFDTPWIVLLDGGAVVGAGWLEALLAAAERDPAIALVGPALIGSDGRLVEAGRVRHGGGPLRPLGAAADPAEPAHRYLRDVDGLAGTCVLVRRAAWVAIGAAGSEGRDRRAPIERLAQRLLAAHQRVVVQPAARVHVATTGAADPSRAREARQARAGRDDADRRRHPGGLALVIDEAVPEPDRQAGAVLTWQHLHLLGDLGIRPVYLPFDGRAREPWMARLQADGIEVLAPDVDPATWLVDHGHLVDLVMVARPVPATRWLPALRRWTDAPIVYFTHDLHFLRERRRAELTGDPAVAATSRELEATERAILGAVDAVLTPSSAEVEPILELAPGRHVGVLPPFVEADEAVAGPPLGERTGVMFLGGFRHLPNIDAALVLVRDVMPLVWASVPEADVRIVGSDPVPEVATLAGPRVTVTGHVPDLAPELARARMTVSPLRFGAGLKGKIVTSLEAGVPVVTTAIGNEGIDLRDGEDALLGETPEALAGAIVRLFREPGLADRLAVAGRARVVGTFSRAAARDALRTALDAARAHRDAT